jgi:hypothetical protein
LRPIKMRPLGRTIPILRLRGKRENSGCRLNVKKG